MHSRYQEEDLFIHVQTIYELPDELLHLLVLLHTSEWLSCLLPTETSSLTTSC
jgi:hypothetical protein